MADSNLSNPRPADGHERHWLRRISAMIAALAIVGGIIWAFMPKPIVVDIARVIEAPFEAGIQEEGRARLRERHRVVAPFAAQLERVRLAVGDPVRAGDVVARLRALPPQLVDWRSVTGLRQRADAARAALAQARATETREAASLAIARAQAERDTQLARAGYLSAAAAENARLVQSQHESALLAAESARHAAEYELAAAESAVLAAEEARSHTDAQILPLRSPVDGWVVALPEESETTVTAGRTILEIGNLRDLEVVVDVLSQQITGIQPGMPVRLKSSGNAPSLAGQVRRVEPVAKTRISALGVEEQRVSVLVDLIDPPTIHASNAGAMIGDGWRVDAFIVSKRANQARQIPIGALFRHDGQWHVFVVDDGRAKSRAVSVLARTGNSAWIGDELKQNQTIIVHPPDALKAGQRVTPRATARAL